jgi:hypothetical protein
MAATELEDVQALLERVLPDPSGFAQRLLLQLMAQFGESAAPGAGPYGSAANAFYTAATHDDATASNIIITPEPPDADEPDADEGDEGLAGTNVLLAAALGACECWGLRADCGLCQGEGSAGWAEPVPELFDEFVGPAIAKRPDVSADHLGRPGDVRPDRHDHHRPDQGEDS